VPRKAKTHGKLKLKTHKATAKRFRLTGGGTLVRTKGGKSHLRRRTPARTKRLFTRMIPVSGKKLAKKIRRLAPTMDRHEVKP
jgi:large subunit ribosomal protein L35